MIEQIQFQTRARTIDHLGREQIADCPTAVSELWKNAYDAYARNVSINLYSGTIPVAVICDNGHGMKYQEIKDKWLVVGTEGKAIGMTTPEEDRNGLQLRPRQGKKGIGRLSCGYLGSLLLLVTKRRNEPYVAALIDWRLFGNPYLLLQDISIPVASLERQEDILRSLPELFDRLMSNVWGEKQADDARTLRIQQAWKQYDEFERQITDGDPTVKRTTREEIEATIINASFVEQHFQEWGAWNGADPCGTALVIAGIDYSLESLLDEHPQDSIAKHARDKFFETLSGFSDPYTVRKDDHFKCSAVVLNNGLRREIIGKSQEFKFSEIEHLEHVLKGSVDEKGTFRGNIKAFGKWLDGEVEIPIHENLELPGRRDSFLGPFDIFIATMEWEPKNTSHSKAEFAHIQTLAEKYSGFMLYRDGLRVMPYGREDSDFFEIEQRRSKHAGREFWNHRRLFGRVAITSLHNPNLRDKAGREGIVDNRASTAMKDIVENILMTSARRFFGTASEYRNKALPERQAAFNQAKIDAARNDLRKKQRKNFRTNLRNNAPKLDELLMRIDTQCLSFMRQEIPDEGRVFETRAEVESIKDALRELRLGAAPKQLGMLENDYVSYRNKLRQANEQTAELDELISRALDVVAPKAPQDIVYSDLSRNANYLHRRIASWSERLKSMLRHEQERLSTLVDSRNQLFHQKMGSIVDDVAQNRIKMPDALHMLEAEKNSLDHENENIFEPYIAALECLQESIDLQGLATFGNEEVADLREEVNRLNELAQLGITVEIVGHELASYDSTIEGGLAALPDNAKMTKSYKSIRAGLEGLTDRLKFLTPLKLSGERIQRWITGEEIEQYVREFFRDSLTEKNISFGGSASFSSLRVYDLPSRILPVFINLVNNAIYWVGQKANDRRIVIDLVGEKVVVADTGPGVEEEDIRSLFTLFFTRKVRGGRGVGLYLCRANLSASGHRIEYAAEDRFRILPGANFVLTLKGAEHV
jgi:signal transduction histidine kinase